MDIKFRVAAGTVTYGDRARYLYQNIDKLLDEDFTFIYVLFNGVHNNLVMEAKKRYIDTQVIFIVSEVNLGSAGGYHKLLKFVRDYDCCDRLLLLDDDNLVPDNFLSIALEVCQNSEDIFYFHRPDRALPLESFLDRNPAKLLGGNSSFLGRTIFSAATLGADTYKGDLLAAPYGGLLLPRRALDVGIFPDQEFFLYADDYDFTFRLCSEAKFNIMFIRQPEIIDLEQSFHLKNTDLSFLKNRYHSASDQQLFFSVRNQILFSIREASSLTVFCANLIFFTPIFLGQFFLNFQFKKAVVFLKAVVQGFGWGLRRRYED